MNLATIATPNRPAELRPRASRWKLGRIPAIFLGVAVLIAAVITYGNATYVTGIEIHCRDWQIRKFSFCRDPFTNYQFTGLKYSTPASPDLWTNNASMTGAFLDPTIAAYLSKNPDIESRWDLIRLHESSASSGPAMILFDLLVMRDSDYDLFWKTWTTAHPAKAKVLWPAAQDLARFQSYSQLPKLFELAAVELSASEFDASVRSIVAAALFDAAREPRNSHQENEAKEVAQGYAGENSNPSKPLAEAE